MVDETKEKEESYSDPENFVDVISDSELKEELGINEPLEGQYEECCIVIFGIPKVGEERLEKLKKVLGKLLTIPSPTYKDYYPLEEGKVTKDFCFVEYSSKESAEAACTLIDGYMLDKNHTFAAYLLTAFSRIEMPVEKYVPPPKQEYVDVGDLWWWLQNSKCLDQFAIQVENPTNGVYSTAVYWNGRGTDPYLVNDESIRENWSENIFKWSPHGTYLTTLHKKGVIMWAGEKFEKAKRCVHDNVNYIEFSPNESFLVTYSRDSRSSDSENCLRIFDVFTGELKRSFSPSAQGSSRIHDWPFFKWSYDEKYFAFCRPKGNSINVYNTDNFKLDDNKSVELDGLVTFEWNPAKNLIAYYCEERMAADSPAVIGIIEFPSRREVRAQRIFSVSSANLFWQKSGLYLAAHTERFNNVRKTKDNEVKLTGITSHLEIFDWTEKEISVQTIQLAEPFMNFGWEPKGSKFCVLVGTINKVTPLVYRLDKDKPVPTLISKIESGTQLNMVEWAPQGGWLTVFSNNPLLIGQVFFIDASGTEANRTHTIDHPSLNQGSWDPTGRYFATCSLGRNRHESGYRIYTFQGRELVKKSIETLFRFKWRPRPPAPLSEQKIKEIRKNSKFSSQQFEEEDRREQLKVSKKIVDKRREVMADFNKIREDILMTYEQEKALRLSLRNGIDTDVIDVDLVDETITIPLTTEIKQIKDESINNMD